MATSSSYDSLSKKKSLLKMQKQQESFSIEMMKIFNNGVEKLTKTKWSDFSIPEKEVLFGILAVVGGWNSSIRTGQQVQVEINN